MSVNKLKTRRYKLELPLKFFAGAAAALASIYKIPDQNKPPAADPPYLEDEGRKPLFIPLKTEYFQAFQDGSKTEELRLYGPGWNEGTCFVGRTVVLSKGYGKQERLEGRISGFRKQPARSLSTANRKAVRAIYETLDIDIACIAITGLEPVQE
jgi:hypothetical protein